MKATALVVAHGACEIEFVRRLDRLLRVPILVSSRRDGGETVSVKGIRGYLESPPFRTAREFRGAFPIVGGSYTDGQLLEDFRIFPMLDIDGDTLSRRAYITGSIFDGMDSDLRDIIVPIYNDPNLDEVMAELGYGRPGIKKTRSYTAMCDAMTDPLELYRSLERCDSTNMEVLLRHIMSRKPEYQSRLRCRHRGI